MTLNKDGNQYSFGKASFNEMKWQTVTSGDVHSKLPLAIEFILPTATSFIEYVYKN
jgi:hypothetical protein